MMFSTLAILAFGISALALPKSDPSLARRQVNADPCNGYPIVLWNNEGSYGGLLWNNLTQNQDGTYDGTFTGPGIDTVFPYVSLSYGCAATPKAALILNEGRKHDYFGWVSPLGVGAGDLESGSANYVFLSTLDSTPVGSGPTSVPNSWTDWYGTATVGEAQLWTYDAANGKLIRKRLKPTPWVVLMTYGATWINSDGTEAETTMFWTSDPGFIGLTGDLDTTLATYGTNWVDPVQVYLGL